MRPDLVPEDLSREHLTQVGTEALSDVELLALVLNRGQRDGGLLVARDLLSRYATLSDLAAATPAELSRVPGIGAARAAAICASIALGRRVDHRALSVGRPIAGSEDVYHHFHGRIGGLKQERFYVLMLDGKGRLAREVRVSEGSLTASIVHPREVFRCAVREAAASLILVHNHPSGDPTPSTEDETLTERLRAAGALLGIRVLDHLVIGRGRYVSFVDSGRF